MALSIILVHLNCTSKDDTIINYKISDFPDYHKITSTVIKLNHYFHKPYRIELNDTLIVFTDIWNNTSQLHIIHRKNNELKSLIPKGEGPNQLSSIRTMFFANDGHLWLVDNQKNKYIKLDLHKYWNDAEYHPLTGILDNYYSKMNESNGVQINSLIQALPLKDSTLVCSRFGEDTLQFEIRSSQFQKLYKKFGGYPELLNVNHNYFDSSAPDRIKQLLTVFKVYSNIFYPIMSVNKSRKELLVVFPAANIFDTYDLELFTLKQRIIGPFGNYPMKVLYNNGAGYPEKDAIAGYHDITYGDHYNYLLYSGQRYNDPDSYGCTFVHVYTFEGQPKAIIELDRKVIAIKYDPNTKQLFTLSNFYDDPIAWFHLPEGLY